MTEPDRCPVCGSIDIVAGHCQHCGSDTNIHNYNQEDKRMSCKIPKKPRPAFSPAGGCVIRINAEPYQNILDVCETTGLTHLEIVEPGEA